MDLAYLRQDSLGSIEVLTLSIKIETREDAAGRVVVTAAAEGEESGPHGSAEAALAELFQRLAEAV